MTDEFGDFQLLRKAVEGTRKSGVRAGPRGQVLAE